MTSAVIPLPLSLTATATNGPEASGSSGSSPAARRTRRVETVSVPPSGIASPALTARLMTACSSWPASTRATSASSGWRTSTCAPPSSSRSSIGRRPVTVVRTSTTVGSEGGATGEREELPRELARAVDDVHDRGRVRADRVGIRGLVADERREAADRRERVVEVVRDAARDAPDGLEPLRVRQLRVQRDPLGHVGELARQAERPAGVVAQDRAVDLDPDLAAVLGQAAHALAAGDLARDRPLDPVGGRRALVVGHHGDRHRVADQLLGRPAEDALGRRVPDRDGPVERERLGRQRRRVDDGGQQRAGALELRLGGVASGDLRGRGVEGRAQAGGGAPAEGEGERDQGGEGRRSSRPSPCP